MHRRVKARRLLNTDELAERFGRSRPWLVENRARLEAAGMPEPIVPADDTGPDLWDEHAIDLWEDSRLPAHLRREPMITGEAGHLQINIAETADKLQRRARELAL